MTKYQLSTFLDDVYTLLDQCNRLRTALFGLRETVSRAYEVGWTMVIIGGSLLLVGTVEREATVNDRYLDCGRFRWANGGYGDGISGCRL